jgi:ubiquinone/menaquinone biosynthesis C-methylase UbiE
MKNRYIKVGDPCTSANETTIQNRLNFILNSLPADKNQIVLDIGTGFGIYLINLSSRSALSVGIDTVSGNLQKINKNPDNVKLILMSAENLAFKDNTFSTIIMIEVLEHLVTAERVISEIFRVLRRDGNLIITSPNKLFPLETHGFRIGSRNYGTKGFGFPLLPYLPEIFRRHVTNAKIYTPWNFKKILRKRGFQIVNQKFLSPNFDEISMNFPKYKSLIVSVQRLMSVIENIPILNYFLMTIIIHAKKE